MSDIDSDLRREIGRLARKAIDEELTEARQEVAAFQEEIERLRAKVSQLEAKLSSQSRSGAASQRARSSPGSVEGRRFSAKGLRSHRQKLGLSAEDYARLVGVSALSIYNWEQGKSRPRPSKLEALIEVRGMGKREAQRRLEEIGKE